MFDATKISPDNFEGFSPWRKKVFVIQAIQLNLPEGFFVDTSEGRMSGKPGDYLVIGIKGEKYPMDREIFQASYDYEE